MNQQIYELLIKILESDLLRDTKDEIVRFYMLPRNTPVLPILEQEENSDLGSTQRPSFHDIKRKNDPKLAETEDEMKKTLRGKMK